MFFIGYLILLFVPTVYCSLYRLGWRGRLQVFQSFSSYTVHVLSFVVIKQLKGRRCPV
jgi:hypothetical protein